MIIYVSFFLHKFASHELCILITICNVMILRVVLRLFRYADLMYELTLEERRVVLVYVYQVLKATS